VIEEQLFARRRDLFSALEVVFFDTTSLYFEGDGGESLGQYGHSKDHRPDEHQMIVGVVLDGDGRPICRELWPGNATDVTTLIPVVDRLWRPFRIRKISIVADPRDVQIVGTTSIVQGVQETSSYFETSSSLRCRASSLTCGGCRMVS
jgi:transposase